MNSSTRVLLTLAAVVVIAFGLKAAEGVVVSFLLAAFIAIIAAPPIFWLEQRRVPDALAITGVMIAIVGILVTVGALLVQSGTAFTDRLPFYQERVTDLVTRTIAWLTSLANLCSVNLEEQARRYLEGCPKCGRTPCYCQNG